MTAESSHPTDALLALVYGELSADEARTVQRHVDGCAECSATVAGYRAVRGAATALPRELAAPAGLESVLHYGAQAAARARVRRGLRWVWPLAAGAVAVWVGVVAVRPPAATSVDVLAKAPPSAGPQLSARDEDKSRAAVEKPVIEEPQLALKELAGTGSSGGSIGGGRSVAPRPAETTARAKAPAKSERRTAAAPAPAAAADAVALGEPSVRAQAKVDATAEAKQGAASSPEAERAARDDGAAASNLAKKSVAASPLAPKGKEALPMVPGAAPPAAPMSIASGAVAAVDGGVRASPSADQTRRATLYVRLRESKGAQLLPVLSELCALEARLGHVQDAVGFCQRVVREYPGTPEAAAAQRQIEILHGG